MVVPYEIGEPVRSFVLVPGTGADKKAKSLCLDLARLSSVAGAVPVHSGSPSGPSSDSLKPSKQNEKEESQDTVAPSGNLDGRQVVAVIQPGSNTQQQVNQEKQDSQVSTGTKRSLDADVPELERSRESAPVTKVMKTSGGRGANISETETEGSKESDPTAKVMRTNGGGANISETESSEVAELRRRCVELQRENVNLNRRLAMFHDLFRNKERITRFVRFLESSS